MEAEAIGAVTPMKSVSRPAGQRATWWRFGAIRRTAAQELTQTEKQYQQTLVRLIILVTFAVTPLIGLGYLAAYLYIAPVWSTLVLALALLGFIPISLYALSLSRRGNNTAAARAYLFHMLITIGLITALLVKSLLLIGIMVAILLALMALFLEPRPVAIRWVTLSGLVYLAGLLTRDMFHMPVIELGVVETVFMYTAPLCLFLTIAVLGSSTMEFLRDALRESETLREQAEQSYKQAQQATMVAIEANRLKSEFLSMMSHELRTPLNAIIGFAGIMLGGMGGKLDSDASHMVNRINANSLHLLDLINNVLDLAKVEAGQFRPIYAPFAPADLIRTRYEEMSSLAKNRNFTFEIEIDPDLPPVIVGDKDIIHRIITNLLSNAFKFTENGSVKLSASLNSNDHSEWIISIADTGIGIPAHALEYIFDPFRQVDGSPSRQFGGTGLGLAIVKELVSEIDARIRVDTVLGKGSTFIVTLPIIVREASVEVGAK